MEAVFKLSRAEVELACAQFLAQRDVRFVKPPTLADDATQDFEHLFFTGEIALAEPVKTAVSVQTPPPQVWRGLDFTADAINHVVAPAAAPTADVPAAAARPDAQTSVLKAASREGDKSFHPAPAGPKVSLGSLLSSDPPAMVKLPASVVDYRRSL